MINGRDDLEIAALSDVGRARAVNEDSALAERLADGSVVLAVADGVGGLGGGEIASAETIRALRDELAGAPTHDPAAALARAFTRANERVRELYGPSDVPMASTLVAALIRDDMARVANLGDSRAYMFSDGLLEQITRDHSLVAEQVSAGVLTPEQAEKSEYANVITRGIGVSDELSPDAFGPIDLAPGSVLLLCSDGLYRVVDEASIADVLSSSSIDQAATRLVDLANRAGGPDNVSVALCRREMGVSDGR